MSQALFALRRTNVGTANTARHSFVVHPFHRAFTNRATRWQSNGLGFLRTLGNHNACYLRNDITSATNAITNSAAPVSTIVGPDAMSRW